MVKKQRPTENEIPVEAIDIEKYRNPEPPKPSLPERTSPLITAKELYGVGKPDEEIISVLTHPGMGYGLSEREARKFLYASKEGYPGNDITYYWLWSLAKSRNVSSRKYTNRELYEGYYWLVLHTCPTYDSSIIHPYHPVPDPVISALKEHPHWQALLGDYKYKTNLPDHLFGWFIRQQRIPRLTVNGARIECWRDVNKLWEKLNLYKISHDLDKLFHELEFYFKPQHQENLKSLTPASQARQGEERVTETPKERQKRNIITIKIEKMDVGLTQTEALCLMALKEELKNRTKYIRPVHITMRVWPDETLKGKNRLKYYWSNLRKKLDAKVELPGFEHVPSKYEGYCLGTKDTPYKSPSWFKKIQFPRDLRLPLAVKPNR